MSPKTSALRPIGATTRSSSQSQPSALRRYRDETVFDAKYHHRYRYDHSSRSRANAPCWRGSMTQAVGSALDTDGVGLRLQRPLERRVHDPLPVPPIVGGHALLAVDHEGQRLVDDERVLLFFAAKQHDADVDG